MPPRSDGHSSFVGRDGEMAELEAALSRADAGRGALVLITGESGIGKSRLAHEVSLRAEIRGVRVLTGRCHEGLPAYRPWIDVIGACIRDLERAHRDAALGPTAAEVSQLVEVEPDSLLDTSRRSRLKAAQTRFRLFEGIGNVLRLAAQQRPLVLVLDDLQSADRPSLQLLSFVARECAHARLMVIGIYRDTDVDADHPLAAAVAEMTHHPHCTQLRLGGLGRLEVGQLMAQIVGHPPAPVLVERVFRETDGNPFFVGEIVRLLAHERDVDTIAPADPLRLPRGVRAVIRRRLGGLSDRCVELLGSAAVIGREFGVSTLAHVTGTSASDLLDELGTATDIAVIVPVPLALGRFRFAHALIRDTLYQEIASTERTRLHRRVGEALEQLHDGDPDAHLAAIAHHFFEAARGGVVDRALEYAVRAARRALGLLAYEEAEVQYARALQLLDLVDPHADALRCELFLGLGDARARAADFTLAKDAYFRAAEVARRIPSPALLAQAALGFGLHTPLLERDDALVEMLETVLRTIGDGHEALRARVLGRLARGLAPECDERRAALCTEAIDVARRLDDGSLLADLLWERHHALWEPDNLDDRIAGATEIVRLAEAAGDREMTLLGRGALISDLFEAGDFAGGRREIASFVTEACHLRQPRFLQWAAQMQATIAGLEGRFADAERHADEALAVADRAEDAHGRLFYGLQLVYLRRYTGDLATVEATFLAFVGRFRSHPAGRCVRAWFDAQLGRKAEVHSTMSALARNGFADVPKDVTWLMAIAALCEPCSLLRNVEWTARIYTLARPYGNRFVGIDFTFFYPFSALLGLLATTMARWDEAAAHFEEGLATAARLGSRPLLSEVRYLYALMLVRRDAPDDAARARAMLDEVLAIAEPLGMTPTVERARTLRARAETRMSSTTEGPTVAADGRPEVAPRDDAVPAPPRTRRHGRFLKEGEYWEIGLDGSAIRLRDSAGLRCLAHLVRHAGQEILATDLMTLGHVDVAPRDAGDAGEALDAAAAAAYRRRLEELRTEAADADELGDVDRATLLREEMDCLAGELARGLGIGGRHRRVGSAAERARVNVTRTIKSALRRIEVHDAALGRYLATTVRTGTYCSYTPDPIAPVDWTT